MSIKCKESYKDRQKRIKRNKQKSLIYSIVDMLVNNKYACNKLSEKLPLYTERHYSTKYRD